MKRNKISILLLLLPFSFGVYAQQKPALSWKDVSKWNSIRSFTNSMSPNGQWLSWTSGPTEGDLKLFIRKTSDTTSFSYPIGATAGGATFSKDSKYAAFKVSATDAEVKAAKKTMKPTYDKLTIVSLPGNEKVTFDRVKASSFSGDSPEWIAIHFAALETAPKDKDAAKGTDLVIYHLASKKSYNLGSVSEFAFNKAGTQLAYTIDANGQNGNGVFLRDMATGISTALENDKAVYKSINWNEKGDAFALLKSNKNEKYKEDVFTVIGISKIAGDKTSKVSYSGIDKASFPKKMGISGNGTPYWSEDQTTLFFGISPVELKDDKKADSAKSKTDAVAKAKTDTAKTAVKPAIAEVKKPNPADIEKPDMIIWNWQDKRLQSAQQTQEMRDKNYSFISSYRVADQKFSQIADSTLRNVIIAPKQLYAIAYDNSNYELMGNLDGQSYIDIYTIDLKTGAKTRLFEKFYASGSGTMSVAPNGTWASYYVDGAFYSINLANGQKYNLTGSIKSSFVDALDDHNVSKPSTSNLGWSADSKYALIMDNNDLWRISADGKSAVSLSGDLKSKKQAVLGRSRIYQDEKGTDLSKDQYFGLFDNETKQTGLGLLPAGKSKINLLFMDNNVYNGLAKATDGNVFAYSKQNNLQSPEVYVSTVPTLAAAKQITKNTPDQEKYAWTSGAKLIKYLSANGDSLQAAIYLPANYEAGKSYPTITYIYERLTDNLNAYTMPAFPGGGFNLSMYTSNGYAVLMPDIKYKLNDPGMSAVACVVPAVKAAVATGIVDEKRVAIHGHSWGGYQTSFLITQTNIFKAAAAGAPLTNMISMYSLIYWNSGGTNQAIFEASQGRLTPGYWDNWDAFARNSPVYHIKKVQTPLLLLHNDKDGAVDYTQGIEYYNGLRRLNKPVVMITYRGENHGIAKLPNRKDYAVRMMEYFDYMLKDKPAPEWWSKGVNRLDMEKHLETRAFEEEEAN
ncbi:alpha/beta hydrolase family protein [Pedobacter metabolipauper]|uniref:Dipeptidyl aminopeptidase/acylaminoacyl peptidase n=1 Tax=Pedobacter metabolipauper TaxID=425513 RepID=A0A4R6SWB8_9SPHI|nr:prolyl oligopeptidase family serine peptidase [Pedobacter metabolipauper]TDQ09676.1 dipeptidyl aminopeptidase/acylaminoacyl peptidase [Pedobacter metabolipauper]